MVTATEDAAVVGVSEITQRLLRLKPAGKVPEVTVQLDIFPPLFATDIFVMGIPFWKE